MRPCRPVRSLRRPRQLALVAMAAAGASLLPLAIAPATFAATAPRTASPVVSPKPGQHVTRHRLKLVVRAGDEYGDLAVTLNGRQVGRDFAPGRRGLRTLHAANSHGLRHGRNVLKVRARRGLTVRRATVRFTVSRRQTLAGAGRDRTVTTGKPVRLGGRFHQAPRGRRATGAVRWRVVRAPRGSRVRRIATPPARRPVAGTRGARASATGRAALPVTPLQPLLRPDVPGTYTLQLKVGSGASAKVDTVDYSAIPADPLVPLDMQVAAAGSSTGVAQPGIRVGATTYRMPYLGFERGRGLYDASGACCSAGQFYAMWQVVALDRTTLEVRWNRTYGYCQVPDGTNVDTWRSCRSPDDPQPGRPYVPMRVDVADEIMREAPGNGVPGALILGRTLGRDTYAGTPESYDGLLHNVGFHAGPPDQGWPAIRQPTSFAGVPGMGYGEADVSARADGELPGYLTVDQNYQFHFLSRLRPQFDTRSSASCDAGSCTVAQTFGGQQTSATVPRGRGGYLISGWDPVTLALRTSTFAAVDGDDAAARGETQRMLKTLQALQQNGSVVAITTLRTPGMPGGSTLLGSPAPAWDAVTGLVASFGGTRHGFLSSVSDPSAEYTLVGWAGAGENGGNEAAGLGDSARLRGALAPNRRSQLRPANVSSVGPPAERINQMMVTPTSTGWARYPNAGAATEAAIQCIGAVLKKGVDVRGEYVNLTTEAQATALQNDVGNVTYDRLGPVPGTGLTCAMTEREFATGRGQLVTELGQVARVRDYLAALSAPQAAKDGVVWGQATQLGDDLRQALTDDMAQDAIAVDALGIVSSLLNLIAPGIDTAISDAEKVTAAVSAAAGTFSLASSSIARASDGGPDVDPNVQAVDLAVSLQKKAQAATAAYTQIGDVIVSDPEKLGEVGTWARCRANVPGGCAAGFEEYATSDREIDDLTQVSLRAMGRTIYQTLVTQIYPTWDTGVTQQPRDPYANYWCSGTSSPFGKVPSSAWSAGLDSVNRGAPPSSRIFLMIGSGATWEWAPPKIADRMFGRTGDTWDQGGLGMDPLTVMRDSQNRFVPGSYSCAFDK